MRRMLFSWRAALAFVAVVVGAVGLRADATLISDAETKDIHGAGCWEIQLHPDGCTKWSINVWCSQRSVNTWWKEAANFGYEEKKEVPIGELHWATDGVRTECVAAVFSDANCNTYIYGDSKDGTNYYTYGGGCP